jgi:hypothetical protein
VLESEVRPLLGKMVSVGFVELDRRRGECGHTYLLGFFSSRPYAAGTYRA